MKNFIIVLSILFFGNVLSALKSKKYFGFGKEDYNVVIQLICKNNSGKFVTNGKKVTQNGCGPELMDKMHLNVITKILLGKKINGCCNIHDMCYGICVGQSYEIMKKAKEQCDTNLQQCIKKLHHSIIAGILHKLVN